MPHSTASGGDRVPPLRTKPYGEVGGAANGLEKFPDLTESPLDLPTPKWPPRRDSSYPRPSALGGPKGGGHRRQKSLTEAIRAIKTRNGSVSQNVHEITDALRAPVSARLIVRSTRPPPFPQGPN